MTKYRLTRALSGEHNDTLLGTIRFDFKAGIVEPKSEGEEVVLEHLRQQTNLVTKAQTQASKEK